MSETFEIVKVGIADLGIVQAPNRIRTSGLGSCVGVVIFNVHLKIAALAHIMLPDSTTFRGEGLNKAKYANTAIEEMMTLLQSHGVRRYSPLKAKIAGGAQMFQMTSGTKESMRIGPRNVAAVKQELLKYNIPIVSADVGGASGRTVEFNPETSMLSVRTVNHGTKEI
ncbi:chemotaxis protein CheD [Salinibacillus xinjiangensis]|uniref:Probable chemoreceptor glutamine deamidase CheD n=1 Tax=Salinibacillus xinjiangensis TaxID=1229268 RepID=A0A6G1X395_9BACI|nr:chemotaxis protein CheD [Salinibacillus xinjiangensis]MRG85376.1 chemotaxis protein CheD [Salinibacillus xinjiangensis]